MPELFFQKRCLILSRRIFAVLFTLMSIQPVTAATVMDMYEAGVAARGEQRFADAVSILEAARTREPDNTDILVQLGFAYLALETLDTAEQMFNRALLLAPDYQDARLGLAHISQRTNNLPEAEALLEVILTAEPDNVEARALQTSLAAPRRVWRLDVGSEISTFSGGRQSWTDSAVTISYEMMPGTILSGKTRFVTRSAGNDTQFEVRLDHKISEELTAYGLFAASPFAVILPKFTFGAGGSWRVLESAQSVGPLIVDLNLRHDVYDTSAITTVSPGVKMYLFDGFLATTARLFYAQNKTGLATSGYLIRADIAPTDQLGLFIGYSFAPEISGVVIDDTSTLFAGASFNFDEQVTIRANYIHEMRNMFSRDSFGIGFSSRF